MNFLNGFEKFWYDLWNFFFIGTNWYNVGYGVGVGIFVLFAAILLFGIVFMIVSAEERGRRRPKIKGY